MKRIAILYATREGQTRRIAEHVTATLLARAASPDMFDVRRLPSSFDARGYDAIVLAASVHAGRHEREMVAFVKEHRAELEQKPTAFLSVSLAEAGAERASATAAERAKSAREAEQVMEKFFDETSFHPLAARRIAGALAYLEYGPLKRLAMRWISKRAGGDTDTSRDFDYTDWAALDRFVEEFLFTIDADAARPLPIESAQRA